MTPDRPSRLAVVEDHELIAAALVLALQARGHDAVALDPRDGPEDTEARLARFRPDLVLHDLDLGPHEDGMDRIRRLHQHGWPVLVVTGLTDPLGHARAVAAGASGIVDKAAPFEHLLQVVDATLAGRAAMSEHERQERLALLRRHEQVERTRRAPFEALTTREAEVLAGLVDGQHVDAIAAAATVSPATVRSQVRAVLTKLDVSSQLAAVAMARRCGWPSRSVRSG